MKTNIYSYLIICVLIAGGILSGPPFAKAAPADSKEKEAAGKPATPINITSDHMEADDVVKVIVFTGTVVARQEDMVLNSDVMRVYYQPLPPAPGKSAAKPAKATESAPGETDGEPEDGGEKRGNEIVRIEAEGNVKITRGNRISLSDKAVYLAKAEPRIIILTGNPRIWRGKDFLTGTKITYILDQDRSIVESAPGKSGKRVNAIFYQRSKGTKSEDQGGQKQDAGKKPENGDKQ